MITLFEGRNGTKWRQEKGKYSSFLNILVNSNK